MPTSLHAVLLAVLPVASVAAQAQGRNPHMFCNVQKAQSAVRPTTTSVDQVLFTQPLSFHYNAQRGMGWQVLIQDQQVSTAESIVLSWHAVEPDGLKPVVAPIATDTFTLFGVGSGSSAFLFTLVRANPTVLPSQVAIGIRLPAPHPWPADAALLHYQKGDDVKLPASYRGQWSWLQAGSVAAPLHSPGSTFQLGGIYDRPVVRGYCRSTAYGPVAEDLAGPESLHPWPSRGDRFGLQVIGDRFRSLATQPPSLCTIFVAPSYGLPLPTPFGPFLLQPSAWTVLTATMSVDGVLTVPPFDLPDAKLTACVTAAAISLMNNELSFANAIRLETIYP
jgi:hypothetical protein